MAGGVRLIARPSDWWTLDLAEDPTPGDPFRVRELARRFSELSADAFEAAAEVRRLAGAEGVAGWMGEAGAVFASHIGELPGQLDKLDTSYAMVGRALTTYASELETAQGQADAALARGREARARLEAAQGQVATAETAVASARSALDTATGLTPLAAVPAPYTPDPPLAPDPAAVTTATNTHTATVDQLAFVNGLVTDAQDDIDAERRLVLAAKGLREEAARTCKTEIDRASDAGIQNKRWWQKAGDALGRAWDAAVDVAKVVVVVAGIAALILGGPLAWIALAAALVVLADTLMRYADDDASLWDVGFALLDCVPGAKGLTTAAGLAKGFRTALDSGRRTLARMAGDVRAANAWTTTVARGLPSALGDTVHAISAGLPGCGSAPTGFAIDGKPLDDLLSSASDNAAAARRGDSIPTLPAETADVLADRARQIRSAGDVGQRRNIATADAMINGEIHHLDAVSGQADRPGMAGSPDSPQFEPFAPPNTRRPTDAEYKILEEIASRIDPNSSGEVILFTERAPCEACESVIDQFRSRFPGVTVTVRSGGVE